MKNQKVVQLEGSSQRLRTLIPVLSRELGELLKNLFQNGYFFSAAMRIAGGTDEVLRNIIAERVLGLPQDERADKKVPFNELPSGKN